VKQKNVVQLARALKVIVTTVFVCNLVVLLLVPGLARLKGLEELKSAVAYFDEGGLGILLPILVGYFSSAWQEVWMFGNAYVQVLTVFLLFCGSCTAVLLWQGRRVVDTIIRENTFTLENAANMNRAAVCCYLISGAALARTVWAICFYQTFLPLLTYCALFIPLFAAAGLLCQVMSALFRQAAEMKAEQDLTI